VFSLPENVTGIELDGVANSELEDAPVCVDQEAMVPKTFPCHTAGTVLLGPGGRGLLSSEPVEFAGKLFPIRC